MSIVYVASSSQRLFLRWLSKLSSCVHSDRISKVVLGHFCDCSLTFEIVESLSVQCRNTFIPMWKSIPISLTFMFSLLTVSKSQWEANNLKEKKMCRMNWLLFYRLELKCRTVILKTLIDCEKWKLNVVALLWAFEPFLAW